MNYYPSIELENEIIAIENESLNICEHCGSTENVKRRTIRGWIYTYCDNCAAIEEKRFNKFYGKSISGEKENKEGTNKETT